MDKSFLGFTVPIIDLRFFSLLEIPQTLTTAGQGSWRHKGYMLNPCNVLTIKKTQNPSLNSLLHK